MCVLKMHYMEFMKMSGEERDDYLSTELLKRNPSLVKRIIASNRRYNSRETIAALRNIITELETENKILNDTVSWMHDTIWSMIRAEKSRSLEAAAVDINTSHLET